MLLPTARFTNRAENYQRFRPTYPNAVIDYLQENIGLKKRFLIADIGSGTGLFSEIFLHQGYRVKAVEPNEAMRLAAEKSLRLFPGFTSVNGSAENTGLPNHCIDLLVAAQAFHWFAPMATKKEFARILKPGGHVLLAWNLINTETNFMSAWAALKEKYITDLERVRHTATSEINEFFSPAVVHTHVINNPQELNYDGLKGLLLSSSYIPLEGHDLYDAMIAELDEIFYQYETQGIVTIDFETKLYLVKSPF